MNHYETDENLTAMSILQVSELLSLYLIRDFKYLSEHHGLMYLNPIMDQDELRKYMDEKMKLYPD
ncbi:hypothetical protein EFBL_1791 [Effusibacillus lacus]|uniref:Uncharacterized protein n=1 Tax=Effusibacillus lacus TaxID=1348429 RepID=A0A292YNV5_9BACL|nr:hypothetical protein EDD64_14430 [Effusibacillus lacus]GAX90165.1 hypothetical protein EFBL_1791 [Effusibacillus lacus]